MGVYYIGPDGTGAGSGTGYCIHDAAVLSVARGDHTLAQAYLLAVASASGTGECITDHEL